MPTTVDSPVERPPLTAGLKLGIGWAFAAITALVVALAPLSSVLVNGEYVPTGPDSFYHARRILDAVANASGFYQFDPLMHVPEGSLVMWPWMYDFVMSLMARTSLALHLSENPLGTLLYVPVLMFPVALLLVLGVCRGLRLSVAASVLAMLATAFFPLNQTLYGIGNIDHHFAEHLFVLGSLAAGFAWLRTPDSRFRAIAAALVLAAAPGVHTALFILQVPLLVVLAVMWFRGQQMPRTTPAFSIALFAATLAVAAPSFALQEGRFEFQTLSWFQVYVAACTGIVAVLLWRTKRTRVAVTTLVTVGLALLAPIVVTQFGLAGDFFSVSVEGMDQISEVQSVWQQVRDIGHHLAESYTYLVFLAPLTLALCVREIWRQVDSAELLVWLTLLAGIVLLFAQLRLHYFGSLALYLPWIVLADRWIRAGVSQPQYAAAGVAAAFLVAYAPGMSGYLFEQQTPSGDPTYATLRSLYVPFADACEKNPGVALANPNDGHYIRFHTKCAVIANNFLLTPQHAAKVREANAMLSLSLAELMTREPEVRYVYARRDSMFFVTPDGTIGFSAEEDPSRPDKPLVRELLSADVAALPANVKMVYQMVAPPPASVPVARLFEIQP
jgi:hypothetical protein